VSGTSARPATRCDARTTGDPVRATHRISVFSPGSSYVCATGWPVARPMPGLCWRDCMRFPSRTSAGASRGAGSHALRFRRWRRNRVDRVAAARRAADRHRSRSRRGLHRKNRRADRGGAANRRAAWVGEGYRTHADVGTHVLPQPGERAPAGIHSMGPEEQAKGQKKAGSMLPART
jgi:hypothetical protein